jgi:hypothetical protein
LHPEKAKEEITKSEAGKTMDVKALSANADFAMDFNREGEANSTVSSAAHPEKQDSDNSTTDAGIMIERRPD